MAGVPRASSLLSPKAAAGARQFRRSMELNFDVGKVFPYKTHLLDDAPPTSAVLSRENALHYYRQMQTIRSLENQAARLYGQKIIRGFCHLYSGQEACAVGIKAVMRPQDTVITSYRCHGWAWLMTNNLTAVFCELTGGRNGLSRGKGGSMHIFADKFYGGHGIVGAHIPLGVGVALKHRYSKTDAISVICYGDGAANQGQVYESLNMAKLWSLPVLFVCENNNFGMGTSAARSSASPYFYKQCHYIPGIQCDGMDVLAVREVCRYCFEHILAGKGPIILELLTYRYFGHSLSDPGTSYRTRDQVKEVRTHRDPIDLLADKIISAKLASEEQLKAVEKEVRAEVKKASKKAEEDKEIGGEELYADVYENYPFSLRGTASFQKFKHGNASDVPKMDRPAVATKVKGKSG